MTQRITVLITTDHDMPDDAIKSVINHLKSAGYDYLDYGVYAEPTNVTTVDTDAVLKMVEPDVALSEVDAHDGRVPEPDPTLS